MRDVGLRRDGGMFPDYFRVPLGASWKTRLIGRFPKNGKPWNKAKNDHMRLSSEVFIMMVVIRSMFSLPHVIDWHCRYRCYRVGDCQPMNLMPVSLPLPVEPDVLESVPSLGESDVESLVLESFEPSVMPGCGSPLF